MSSREDNKGTGAKTGAAVGAGAGWYFGGPVGAAVGGLAGGAIGSTIGGIFGNDAGQNTLAQVGPRPEMDPYASIRGANGYLADPYRVTAGKLGDTSAWQRLAQEQNVNQRNQSISDAQTRAKTGALGAWRTLAQGGSNAGAKERMLTSANRDAMMQGQRAYQEGTNNALNIGLQGEQMNRAGEQFNITNELGADQSNAGRAIADVGGLNQYNQFGYGERMKDYTGRYAAAAASDAAANQKKGLLGSIFS